MTEARIPFAVWEGRFQPRHVGHLLYARKMLEVADRLMLVVLANETSAMFPPGRSPCAAFTTEVDANHCGEKNPFPLWLRLTIVQSVIREALPTADAAGVVCTAGHRMDLDADFYRNQLLPPEGAS